MTPIAPTGSASQSRALVSAVWILLAIVACSSMLLLNGRPLFYFDTVGYVDQGNTALAQLGVIAPPPKTLETAASEIGSGGAVRTVDGSRSAFYSVLAAAFSHLGMLEGVLVVNAVAMFLAVGLMARLTIRLCAPRGSPVVLACWGLIAASAGSLPFYFAYLMPDLLAPVLILSIAMLTGFGRDMSRRELGLAFGLGAFAIISHLSHFAIAGLMFLASVALSLLASRQRWWVGPLLVLAILGVAYGQEKALRLVAQSAAKSEVIIKPYITARLIQDGPGLRYLETHCPNPEIPTCALYEALQWSKDPYRLTASHIIFEHSQRLGSFKLMTPENQKAVAQAQLGFLVEVLKDRPVATLAAFVRNSLLQSSMVSVDMTLPSEKMVVSNASVTGALSGPLVQGRLANGDGWLTPLVRVQESYYLGALAVALVLIWSPRTLPVGMKVFVLMVVLGILANAFVCGGISQPATRYGARVIWLLPMVAAMLFYLVLFSPGDSSGEASQ